MSTSREPSSDGQPPDGQRGRACVLTLPNDERLLPVALGFIRELAKVHGFDDRAVGQIEVAVEEAVMNVFRHAYAPGEDGDVDLAVLRTATGLELRVRDRGLPYDPTLTPEYDPAAAAERGEPQGLGTFLMKRLMDEVEFRNLGMKGKEVCLLKYLDTPAVFGDPASAARAAVEQPADITQAEFDIHFMRPGEAVEVARCFYESYGYTYAGEHMYYPDRVAALNADGKLISAVATVVGTGEVAAHISLELFAERPGIAELGRAATKPRYRGQSVARQLSEFLLAAARDRGLGGVFGEAVTSHTYSQRLCHRLQFTDCAFLLAMAPDFTSFRDIAPENHQRESVVLAFQYLRPPPPGEIYPPERHAGAIRKIYDGLNVDVAFGRSPSEATLGQHSVLSVSVNPLLSFATMRVESAGIDLLKRVRQEIYRLKRDKLQLAQLLLDLRDPATPHLVPQLEQLGLLFTGLLPSADGHDTLIMQYFSGIAIDYDAIQLDAEAGRALLAYIRMNDPAIVG